MVRWLRHYDAFLCVRSIVHMNKNDGFSALIVWKKLIDICFLIKSSLLAFCLYEISKNDLVDDMKLWPLVTFPDVYCYLIVTPVDFTGEKLKAYNFVISGWVMSL